MIEARYGMSVSIMTDDTLIAPAHTIVRLEERSADVVEDAFFDLLDVFLGFLVLLFLVPLSVQLRFIIDEPPADLFLPGPRGSVRACR